MKVNLEENCVHMCQRHNRSTISKALLRLACRKRRNAAINHKKRRGMALTSAFYLVFDPSLSRSLAWRQAIS